MPDTEKRLEKLEEFMNQSTVDLRYLKEGVGNFRSFQTEARAFFSTFSERERMKDEALRLADQARKEEIATLEKQRVEQARALDEQRKERTRNAIAISAIIVAAIVTIGIALCGWAYANVFKPIVDDIYKNHPAARIQENIGTDILNKVYAKEVHPMMQDAQVPSPIN